MYNLNGRKLSDNDVRYLRHVPNLTVLIFFLVKSEEEKVLRIQLDLELYADYDQYPQVERDVLGTSKYEQT